MVVLHAALGYVLLSGMGSEAWQKVSDQMRVFDVVEMPDPPPDEAPRAKTPEPEGEAAPPNLESEPTQVVAPAPRVALEIPPPIIAAPIAGVGADSSAGAAETPGPGTGAGGVGNGRGSGGSGSGKGGGGGGTGASPARYLSGSIANADYPRAAFRSGAQGSVTARLSIGTDGRVAECRIVTSSGNEDLDKTTCRLIQQRFRYQPALDSDGQPTTDVVGWRQTWWLEGG